jgi:ribosomal protein S18 acetylase RimI-like enzyme
MTDIDYPAITALAARTEGVRMTASESPRWHAAFLSKNPGMCFVADRGGALIGFVYCGHDGRRALIYHLAVHPDARGAGVGAALMACVERAIARAGISRGLLMVLTSNASAAGFYEALGWRARPDLIVMAKDFPDGSDGST